ncbi:MAG: hemolysin family protein [Armatimonadetes bacterium]|nr:hemolysin family protein [Armatimonadota bacterium]
MGTDIDPFSFAGMVVSTGNPGIVKSVILIFLLLFCNAFFSMAEIAIVSVRKTRIKQLVDEGVSRAKAVQRLLEDPTRFLATVQMGITLVGFFASAAGAATLAEPLAKYLQATGIPIVADNPIASAVVLLTLVIVFLSLVIGETAPKSLALQHAEKIALLVASPMLWLSYLTAPFVKTITAASNLFVRPFGGRASFSPPILTEEELKMLVEAGEEEGVLEEEEKEMIHSIFEFTDTVVRKVMTPRTDMKCVEVNASVDELLDVIIRAGHSRVPIYEDTVDNIVGVVHAKDLLRALHENGKKVNIRELMRPPYIVPENKKVDELLAEFKKSKIQMAIVVDEYGGTAGLVTIEDILEEIVGDIMDEYDVEEPMTEILDENTMIVDARIPISEINELMDIQLPEEEFDTIGGFVFGLFGTQPHQGQAVEYNGIKFVVEKTDGRRIQKVRIIKPPKSPEDEEEIEGGGSVR